MGTAQRHLFGIAHVKIGFFWIQKICVTWMLGRFGWTTWLVQCEAYTSDKISHSQVGFYFLEFTEPYLHVGYATKINFGSCFRWIIIIQITEIFLAGRAQQLISKSLELNKVFMWYHQLYATRTSRQSVFIYLVTANLFSFFLQQSSHW